MGARVIASSFCCYEEEERKERRKGGMEGGNSIKPLTKVLIVGLFVTITVNHLILYIYYI